MKTGFIIIVNIIMSLFYLSNGITAETLAITAAMIVWGLVVLILHGKGLHAVLAILLSSLTTTAWMGQPAGMLLAFIPISLILFGGVKGVTDNIFVVGWETRIAIIIYGALIYTSRILQYGFDLQELGLIISSVAMVVIAGRNFRENAINIRKALAKEKVTARYDKLTGLLTRANMESAIVETARKIDNFSVIMLDVDKFKSINDTYGHTNGDMILKDLASAIKNNVREGDLAFRYGGDEFMILCPSTYAHEAQLIAERVRQAFYEKTYHFNEETQQFHISLGLAECRYGEFESATDIIKKADEALYAAKSSGKNTVSVYN